MKVTVRDLPNAQDTNFRQSRIRLAKPTIDLNTAPYAILLLRISLGVLFLAHGLLKVFVFTPSGTAQFFDSVGLPGLMAYPVILLEVFGGIALLAGFYSRWVAISLFPVLLVATLHVHWANGWLFSNENGGWEFPALFGIATVVQFLLGDGPYALSTRLRQRQ